MGAGRDTGVGGRGQGRRALVAGGGGGGWWWVVVLLLHSGSRLRSAG